MDISMVLEDIRTKSNLKRSAIENPPRKLISKMA